MAAPSFDQLIASAMAEVLSRRPDLAVNEGDISEMLLYGGGAMADHVIAWAARRFAETFLDGARRDALTTLGDDHWNLQRHAATVAVGEVTVSRGSAAAGAGTIDAGTVVGTEVDVQGRQVQFILLSTVSYGASETGSKTATAAAVLPGREGNVEAGEITRFISPIFDPSITVTNVAAFAGGSEEESDESYKERIRQLPATIRRATLAALEFGALRVPGVAKATALEDETGIVTVYVSDIDGNSNSTMTDAVAAELENWRAAGVLVQVSGGAVFTLTPIVVQLAARAGVNTLALVDRVKDAIVARVNKLKIGEPRVGSNPPQSIRDMIRQAVMNVDPDGLLGVTVSAPAVDVFPAANQLVRTTAADITVT